MMMSRSSLLVILSLGLQSSEVVGGGNHIVAKNLLNGASDTTKIVSDANDTTNISDPKTDYTGYKVVRISEGLDRKDIAFLTKRVDFWTSPYQNISDITFLVSPQYSSDVKKYFQSKKISFMVLIKNFQTEIDRDEKENQCNPPGHMNPENRHFMKRSTIWDDLFDFVKTATGSRNSRKVQNGGSVGNSVVNEVLQKSPRVIGQWSGMNWLRYHRLGTIYSWMDQIADSYPDNVKLNIIGITEEGRNIVVLKIGGGRPNRPAIFIEGGIHAREWISPATVTFMVNQLVTDPDNRDLLDYYDFYVLPVANPDGYEYTHTKDRMWRKNRGESNTFLNLLTNCKGVDLNRNFAYNWGEDLNLLNSQPGTAMPCLETYIGDKAFSEAETQAIKNFVLLNRHRIVAYLAYHSFGQKMLYPWSHTQNKIHDWTELHHMANAMAEAAFKASGGSDYYEIGTAADIQYMASGGSDDWARGVAGIKWVYLIELPGKGHGFLLPPKWIQHVARSSMAGLRGLVTAISETLPR